MNEGPDLEHTLGNLPTGHGTAGSPGGASSELSPGALVRGRYRVARLLGRGGAGCVYLATDEHLGRQVALKTLHAAGDREALRHESRVLAALSHPNIVTLFELELDGSPALAVTELMQGGSLAERVARTGPLGDGELLSLTRELGAAITIAHASGVLHRDIKPGNVLYSAAGVAKLGDFGLAHAAGADADALAGAGAGTLLYSAPEQLRDAGRASIASDLFSFGATLYFASTGLPPHSIRLDRVPTVLRQVVENALELDPAKRPPSITALLELVGEKSPARHGTPVGREQELITLNGRSYVLEGHIAEGNSSSVHLGRWTGLPLQGSRPLGERVIVKVLRAQADADLLRREFQVLERLHASRTQGSGHFTTRLPEPIALGVMRAGAEERPLMVLSYLAGFSHSLADVMAAFPTGIDGRIAVWLLKRVLELLSFVHGSGVVHGAVIPSHVLVHHRDHGAVLCGWSAATSITGRGERLPVVSRAWQHLYPDHVRSDRRVSPATDIQMAARTVLAAAGVGDPTDAEQTRRQLKGAVGDLFADAAAGRHDDPWQLMEQLTIAARRTYGSASYHPIVMPPGRLS